MWRKRLRVSFFLSVVLMTGDRATADQTDSQQPWYLNPTTKYATDLTIGGDIDDELYFMFHPIDMAVDSDGNLFVLDFKGYCVKKFDANGEHLATFGREGEGPGEMQRPFHMELNAAGQVYVYDSAMRRFSIFDNSGNHLKTIKLTELGWKWISDFRIGPRGRLFIETRNHDFQKLDQPPLYAISHLDLETFQETTIDSAYITDTYTVRDGNNMTSVTAPFARKLAWGILPSGDIVICSADDYVIKIFSADFTLLTTHGVEAERRKVTRQDKTDYLEAFDEESRKIAEKAAFPKYKPYFELMLVDRDGHLLFRLEADDGELVPYDVFTPDARALGQAKLPRLKGSAIISKDNIYNVELIDEQSLAVQRYKRP